MSDFFGKILAGIVGAVVTAAILYLAGALRGSVAEQIVIPSGAVVAFSGECPERGWTSYGAADGKYILGADGEDFIAGIPGGQGKILYKNVGQYRASDRGEAIYTLKPENIEGETKIADGDMFVPLRTRYIALNMCIKS